MTNGRLGSINHTILSLEAIERRGIELKAVIYNEYFDNDAVIAEDTSAFIERWLVKHFPATEFMRLPRIKS